MSKHFKVAPHGLYQVAIYNFRVWPDPPKTWYLTVDATTGVVAGRGLVYVQLVADDRAIRIADALLRRSTPDEQVAAAYEWLLDMTRIVHHDVFTTWPSPQQGENDGSS